MEKSSTSAWNDPRTLRQELAELERLLGQDKRVALHELKVQKEIMSCLVYKARDWLGNVGNPGCKECANVRRHLGDLRMMLAAPSPESQEVLDFQRDAIVRALRNARYALRSIELTKDDVWAQVLDEMRNCWGRLRLRFEAYRLHLVVIQSKDSRLAKACKTGILRKLRGIGSALEKCPGAGERATHDTVCRTLGDRGDEGSTLLFKAVSGLCEWDADGCHRGTEEEEERVYLKHH